MIREFVLASTAALVANAANAQIVPYTEVAGYKIARVEGNNVCFGVAELTSIGDHPMIYSYYQTDDSRRWHVAGYASDAHLEGTTVAVRVTIDDAVTIERETQTREGDFMLPFEALAEIEGHEALVATGETMVIDVNGGEDQLVVPLSDFRAALAAINNCLITL